METKTNKNSKKQQNSGAVGALMLQEQQNHQRHSN